MHALDFLHFPVGMQAEGAMDTDTPSASGDAEPTSVLPEVEIFCYLLVIMLLVDREMYAEVSQAPDCVALRLFFCCCCWSRAA
jgi:hypothetical protein